MTMKKLVVALAVYGMSHAAIAVPPDNTQANSVAVNSSVKSSTADGQSNLSADVKITQQIRKSVMADKNLSTYAHNVKIVTVNGAVTLNGVVRSDAEKATIETKAKEIAGAEKVTDDLTVAPKT